MNQITSNRLADYDVAERMSAAHMEPVSRNYLQVIWDRKWIAVTCVVLGLIGAEIKYKLSTQLYTASAQILVQQTGVQLTSQGNLGQSNNLYTQAELIKKPAVLVIARDNAGFLQMKTFADKPNPMQILETNLTTSVGKTDDLITISFDTPYKEDAAPVVNAVVAAYKAFTTKQRRDSADRFIEESLPSRQRLDDEVKKQADELSAFREKNGMVDWDADKGGSVSARLDALEDGLRAATDETAAAKLDFDTAVSSFIPDPEQRKQLEDTGQLSGVMPTVGVAEMQLREDLSDAGQKLADLKLRYLENHPAVQNAQARVNQLAGMYVMLLHQKWVLAEQRQTQAAAAYDRQKKLADEINTKRAEYEVLEDNLQRTRKLLDTVDTQMKTLNVASEAAPLNVDVYQEAEQPPKPSKPNQATEMFEGLMIGLIVGLGLSLTDQRLLASVDEISATVGLPVLGVIPHMSRRQTIMSRGRKVHLDPMSDIAEAYRNVRTAVFFGAPDDKAKTILITSATRGDGKSTLASNLAIAVAESGQRVLLIDADLREPTQHRIFSATSDKGVSTVVAGRTTVDRAVQATAIKNLDILPCGPIPVNPAEIVNNQAFADMLDVLSQRYDRIIIDSPPVMPVTDARILGATCDLTLLVLRAERTTRRAGSDARDGLLGFGARILGIVVNDGRRRQGRYSYYGNYGVRRTRVLSRGAPGNGQSGEPGNGSDMMVLSKGR